MMTSVTPKTPPPKTPLDGGLGCDPVRHRLVRDPNPGVVALSLIALR
jgi:hypothetical protein